LASPQTISTRGNRRKVTFVLSTALTAGGGTEQFVLNVVKHAPLDRFTISVVQTDLQDRARLDLRFVQDVLGPTNLYNIRSFRKYVSRFEVASKPALYPFRLVLKELVTYLISGIYRSINRPSLDKVRDSDLIYLVRNNDLPYLKIERRTVVLGSTHSSTLTIRSKLKGLRGVRKHFRALKYRRIDGFHFTSGKWWKIAVLHKKYDFLLPLGTDTSLHYPLSKPGDGKRGVRFLFVSRLEEEKGVTRLLDAWKLVNLDNAELHIAGTGSLAELVKEAANSQRIVYHGVLSDGDLAALYRSCDVFVFPAQNEIYGLVVLEALASGLFTIVGEDMRGNFDEFENMGMLEYVQHEPKTLADSMTYAARNLKHLAAKRIEVYEYIRVNHDWSNVSATLYSIFDKILSEVA
jgi:glycosyltransferase involved in cell wall biosynthesis